MTQNPSSGGGATQPTGSPATGTPAAGSATPQSATLTLEEALKQIADLKQHAQNKESEAAHHGKRLTEAEKELATYKAAEEQARQAQMSELEKAQKQAADAQEQLEQHAAELFEERVFGAVARLAGKFNFTVSAETLADMILLRDERRDDSKIEFENGRPTNIEKLLDKLAKAEPDLVKKEAQQNQPQGAPNLPAFGISGRSSIQSPGAGTPGRPPSLTDPSIWRR